MTKTPQDIFTIGLIQHACIEDRVANHKTASDLIRQAAAKGAQIICLQELFSTPYFCTVQTPERFELAESLSGPTVQKFQTLAKELEVVIVLPFFERRTPGVYHNSAAVLDADGSLLGVYRKMHIPDDPLYFEKYYFTPGEVTGPYDGFQVFHTRYAAIGVLICWDQWFPEAARITSLLGAEILFYPTTIGWHPKEKAEFGKRQVDAWLTIQRAHAIANGVYVGAANRVGHEDMKGTDGLEFFGNSFLGDPFGNILTSASSTQSEVLVGSCSRKLLEDTRRNWPFLRDRRIDAYGAIGRRYVGDGSGCLKQA